MCVCVCVCVCVCHLPHIALYSGLQSSVISGAGANGTGGGANSGSITTSMTSSKPVAIAPGVLLTSSVLPSANSTTRTITLSITNTLVGRIIGKAGHKINAITEQSGEFSCDGAEVFSVHVLFYVCMAVCSCSPDVRAHPLCIPCVRVHVCACPCVCTPVCVWWRGVRFCFNLDCTTYCVELCSQKSDPSYKTGAFDQFRLHHCASLVHVLVQPHSYHFQGIKGRASSGRQICTLGRISPSTTLIYAAITLQEGFLPMCVRTPAQQLVLSQRSPTKLCCAVTMVLCSMFVSGSRPELVVIVCLFVCLFVYCRCPD